MFPPGSSRASWLCRPPRGDLSRKPRPDSDSGSFSSGTPSLPGAAAPSPPPPAPPPPQPASPDLHAPQKSPAATKESDALSDEDDGFSEAAEGRRGSGGSGAGDSSPTSAIEAQFLQLELSEGAVPRCAPAPRVQPERVGDTPEAEPRLLRGHFGAIKRKPGSLRSTRTHSRSLDGQDDPPAAAATTSPDLNALLEREFSVHSLTSVVNEDCFFDPAEGAVAAAAANSGHGDASSCSSSS